MNIDTIDKVGLTIVGTMGACLVLLLLIVIVGVIHWRAIPLFAIVAAIAAGIWKSLS